MRDYERDAASNASQNKSFADVLDARRRGLLQGGLGMAALRLFGAGAAALARAAEPEAEPPRKSLLGFAAVPASSADSVVLPKGYRYKVLYAWGDPVSEGPAYKPAADHSAAEQAQQAGMHHDGMQFFAFADSKDDSHGLLCINHEYADDGLLHSDGMADWSAQKVAKCQAAHGVSIIEVKRERGEWNVVRPSKYARRITATTPMRLTGPAAGSDYLKTEADPSGTRVNGTLNNCACGRTPWGTYLTCEENFNFYFVDPSGSNLPDRRRYGINAQGLGYRWHEFDARFDMVKHPNEVNRFGWVVEIDPFDPASTPVKRTALGRVKHEGATMRLTADGRVAFYMGDDERFDYLYKFVTRDKYDPAKPQANKDLLDHGTLYVARFRANGAGEWLELTHGKNGLTRENEFLDQADVRVRTRQAADQAGATKMDRPEWIAVHPGNGKVFVSLTNNLLRSGGDVNAANPRAKNSFGHIVYWQEADNDAAALTFEWDVFVLCGDPALDDDTRKGNIKGDLFACPDGLAFDQRGVLWIATDMFVAEMNKGEFKNFGNNQLLAADTETGEIRRFLTGPPGCEITGPLMMGDGKALLVNIQHPGETPNYRSDPANPKAASAWPDGDKGTRPRSATIVITREDGGVIGA